MKSDKIYFKNLNGLRFIAALMVIVCHIEQFKFIKGFQSYWIEISVFHRLGELGVNLFFVLSGFLITFLLMSEQKKTNKINIPFFYFRRALRIWPLYFLIVLLAFFILPHIDFMIWPGDAFFHKVQNGLLYKLFYFVFMLPNLGLISFGMVPYVSHLWSIGTEEQFYFIWPVIIRFSSKYKIHILILIVLLGVFLPIIFGLIDSVKYNFFIAFLGVFKISNMAMGGIIAFLLFTQHKYLAFILNKKAFFLSLVMFSILIIFGIEIPYFNSEFFSILFGLIILNLAVNTDLKFSLEQSSFKYLGNISYGLYMWHPIAVFLVLAISASLNFTSNWFVYTMSIITTIGFASLCYHFVELPFLKFKDKFAIIKSGGEK